MQCFKVLKNEIKNRLDVNFYIPEFQEIDNIINNSEIKYESLENITLKITDGAHQSPSSSPLYSYKYVTVKDINDYGEIDLEHCNRINKDDYIAMIKTGCKPEVNDILFSKDGTVGKVYRVKEKDDFVVLSSLAILRPDTNKILPEYLEFILRNSFTLKIIKRLMSGAAIQRIILDNLKQILIPVPSLKIQKEYAQKLQQIYQNKLKKEREAEEILNSTEKFILEKLEILLPEIKDKDIYTVSAKDIKHKRIDPYYFQPKFENTISMIKKSKYGFTHLNNVINECGIAKGFSPSDNEKDGDSKVLQIKNINTYGNIDTSYWQSSIKDIYYKTKPIQKNDIIVVVTGATIGKVAIWNKENEDFYLGGDMIKFQVSDNYNPLYVLSFLLTQLGQLQILRNITGATNGHLSPDDVKNIVICDAPQAVQGEIATKYYNNILQAE
ncbi:MAG: restriction endonuclease subunit S, partial [Methanobrevibacter sp.]|nr:restriction endonuclease subunit S [Methanobrevibacter sp.]